MLKQTLIGVVSVLLLGSSQIAYGQTTKLVVAYASPAATFCPGWIARREGIFAKYGLDVEMVLMQGASTYMPALASGNIQVLYGGGTAVSRAIATGGFDLIVIATDGYENGSSHTDLNQARAIIKWMEAKGWSVTFIGCDFNNEELANKLGVTASQAIGVAKKMLTDAGASLGAKRVANDRSGAPIHWNDDEKQQFGGYLSGPQGKQP
jgi:hypothetical protein